ncbi:DUF5675 family protein [Flavivirga abyssicola]|uniref:DUF5675 family protein n=1 Tax=Flavivirga abyssicola TaxID=3063533 RepID=UPI0026E03D83|nr:DUF5675 family protein [Flavivirga sp. MEBiC07777]WVK13821.1 DUF5675 family protein [Flavivirga sp. MEBiC07777]
MELILNRAYFKEGTNGTLFCADKFLCHTIELPWRENKRSISCIPEGRYKVVSRYSKRFKNHLWIKGVSNRRLILIHPANDALKELEGCIAPVTYLGGLGKGIYSRDAMQKLLFLVHQAQDRKKTIFLTIKS